MKEYKEENGVYYRFDPEDEMWEIQDTPDGMWNKMFINARYKNLTEALEKFREEVIIK